MRRKKLPGLGDLQAEVMEFVWKHQEATVAAVAEHVGKRRAITYTTVLVAMQKLEKKGWLTHRAEGRAYVYRPTRSRAAAQTNLVTDMLDAVFDGDLDGFIDAGIRWRRQQGDR